MPQNNTNETSANENIDRLNEDLSEPYSEVGELMDALQEAFTGDNPSDQGLGTPK
jgi:hypothetical protein